MPKLTTSDRIRRHIHAYGAATTKELEEKYDVTHGLISQLLRKDIIKTPSFIISAKGNARRWSKATTMSGELWTLVRLAADQREAYLLTHHETYRKNMLLAARKMLAVAYEMYLTLEMTTASGLIAIPDETDDTKRWDHQVKLIRQCLTSGNPQFPDMTPS